MSLFLAACDSGTHYAPVMDVSAVEPIPKSGIHQVAKGETVYEIAWRYGLDYRYVAHRNQIAEPYAIHSGQKIYVHGSNKTNLAKNAKSTATFHSPTSWRWPVKGNVVATFSRNHKGINIAGLQGTPIYAAAAGKVVYCGAGLRGYGNLIIIKHSNLYLSAYAHNRSLMVKEGEWVKQGQKIAEMGDSGAANPLLYFEIRRAGEAIDPLSLLKK